MNTAGPLSQADIQQILQLIHVAANEEVLARYRHTAVVDKYDGTLVTEADTAMQDRICTVLQQGWPHIGFLGEEMTPAERQAVTSHPEALFWCLDPVDGTTNFSAGTPFFSISLALIDQQGPVFGAVYDPARDEMFSATRGAGARCNDRPMTRRAPCNELKRFLAVVDFKRLPDTLAQGMALQRPYRSQRNFGSCALEWAWLADSRFDVYLHGGMRLWDFAAGYLLLQESGGVSGDYEGNPVFRVTDEPVPVVAARDPQTYRLWHDWIQACLQQA